MIRSSPCTSTSCWSSGEKSTWSPTAICRTFGPTPRASPHPSRLAPWAVAGIRMPPLDRRSPSSLRRETSSRSCSILIGSPPVMASSPGTSDNATRAPPARFRARNRAYLIAPNRGSAPAEGVELLLLDAEVVRDLVDDGDRDLLGHLVLVLADVADRRAVDHDPVRQGAAVVGAALGQRIPLVEPEQVRLVGV